MQAMVLERRRTAQLVERPDPVPAGGEVRVRVPPAAFAAPTSTWSTANCPIRISDRSRPRNRRPGRALGRGVERSVGERVGIPWLGQTCGHCPYCREGRENLCDHPLFTGYTRDGGFATHAIADARYVFRACGEERR